MMDRQKKETDKTINADPFSFPRNPNKQKLCEVEVEGASYGVYEYDLRDTCFIDRLNRSGFTESDVILAMLRLAMPEAPEELILSLTQSQCAMLIARIQDAAMSVCQQHPITSSLH